MTQQGNSRSLTEKPTPQETAVCAPARCVTGVHAHELMAAAHSHTRANAHGFADLIFSVRPRMVADAGLGLPVRAGVDAETAMGLCCRPSMMRAAGNRAAAWLKVRLPADRAFSRRWANRDVSAGTQGGRLCVTHQTVA